MWHTAPVHSVDDLRKHEITIGATGRAASSYVVPSFINSVLGARMKLITGYGSGGDLNIAMERGETQGRGNFYSGFTGVRPDWIRDNKIRFILTMGPRHPALANVPRRAISGSSPKAWVSSKLKPARMTRAQRPSISPMTIAISPEDGCFAAIWAAMSALSPHISRTFA